MKRLPILTITTALVTAAGSAAFAQDSEVSTATQGEWVSLTGSVSSVMGDSFTLDYGDNDLTVEMDDFDLYDENFVIDGDEVTVTGRIDTDFVENKTLEASSVYVESLNEYFYASAADEEDGYNSFVANDYWDGGDWITMTGEVESVDGQTFTLDTGVVNYVIDTDQMSYNPLDSEGSERLQPGERVVVSGEFDTFDLFGDEDIEAEAITTLTGSSANSAG